MIGSLGLLSTDRMGCLESTCRWPTPAVLSEEPQLEEYGKCKDRNDGSQGVGEGQVTTTGDLLESLCFNNQS